MNELRILKVFKGGKIKKDESSRETSQERFLKESTKSSQRIERLKKDFFRKAPQGGRIRKDSS